MQYNSNQHHRRSIRLQGYDYTTPGAYFITICTYQRQCLLGEIVDGEMQLNRLGKIARSHWLKLPNYHPHLQLDAFVVMPNHVHGILVINHPVGAGFDQNLLGCDDDISTKPAPTQPTKPNPTQSGPNKPPSLNNHHGIPEIIRGFKTFSARSINQHRKMTGVPLWQRNYYEHIIRNEQALHAIRQYIHNNPLAWQKDRLRPDH